VVMRNKDYRAGGELDADILEQDIRTESLGQHRSCDHKALQGNSRPARNVPGAAKGVAG